MEIAVAIYCLLNVEEAKKKIKFKNTIFFGITDEDSDAGKKNNTLMDNIRSNDYIWIEINKNFFFLFQRRTFSSVSSCW